MLDVVCGGLLEPGGLLSIPFAIGIESKVLDGLGGEVQGDRGLDLIEGGDLRVLMFSLPAIKEVGGQEALEGEMPLLLLLLVALDHSRVPLEEIVS